MPAIRGSKSNRKTRRHTRDIDEIHADLADPKRLAAHKASHAAEDLPALGEFYCAPCAKWFESRDNLDKHVKAKPHKRRLRQLKEEPYTQKEAEAAVGLTTDSGRSEQMAVDEPSTAQDAAAAIVSSHPDQYQREQVSAGVKNTSSGEINQIHDHDNYDDKEEYDAFFKVY